MNYEQAIEFIHSTYKFGSKLGLENINKLCELLGNPQDSYKIIHVAGTNGKGSTCNMIHDVLVASGYKTGLFISPFLEEFEERIQINKINIDKTSLARMATLIKEKSEIMIAEGFNHPTEFEVVTAIGMKYFEEQKIDFLVLEVGLGGRLDASNVIKNCLLSIITSISYDHMEYLGDTLEKITFEKAGIIKENSQVVIYPQDDNIKDVIKEQAKLKNARVYEAEKNSVEIITSDINGQKIKYMKNDIFNIPEFSIKFLGEHQLYNCATALLALEIIKNAGYNITENSIINGLANCKFAGRFEIVNQNPMIILDGGHNIDGIKYFTKTIEQYFKDKKIILFYGMLKDKNPENVVDNLINVSKKIYTLTPNNNRAMTSDEMAELLKKHNNNNNIPITSVSETSDIIDILRNINKNEIIAFVGSLYLIGDIRTALRHSEFFNNNK